MKIFLMKKESNFFLVFCFLFLLKRIQKLEKNFQSYKPRYEKFFSLVFEFFLVEKENKKLEKSLILFSSKKFSLKKRSVNFLSCSTVIDFEEKENLNSEDDDFLEKKTKFSRRTKVEQKNRIFF